MMTQEPDHEQIQAAVREKYRKVARSAEGLFKYATGREGALALGYDARVVADAPCQLIESFCGVGNPFSLGDIQVGETVLDVGCGAGFDVYMASRIVGEAGQALGVDLTPEMVTVAKDNIGRLQLANAAVRPGGSEALPFDSNSIDVVLSNGTFNLSPNKRRTFEEVFRVLKQGGRLQFADIVLKDELPSDLVGSLEAWSQ